MSTTKAHANQQNQTNQWRCKEKGDYNLRAVIQDSNMDLTTPVGQVLTTVEMEGGSWDFTCNYQANNQGFLRSLYIGTGRWGWDNSWVNDNTVCLIPGLSGIGIRFYASNGSATACDNTNMTKSIVMFANGTVLNGSASYSPFAELIRIGDIPPGNHVLPSTMQLRTTARTASNAFSPRYDVHSLVFTNPTLGAHLCTMVGFNQTIDFGNAIARGNDIISKPFDVWLTDCSGVALTEYKNSAKLSFASTRISPDGSKLNNCDDSNCAIGAYISFEDHEGDSINLNSGYLLNAQTNTSEDKLSFNANLHTDSTSGGKVDTSITLVLEYL
ncbi:fimbrial protein [Shewanella fidelis]|uniref:Fimbrial-type adhesion domain-containing protein n=1 Tax=Shewanella fidelis TaxID=173509 RepID=A0AAW8NHS8_9GAMM|nr:hypothetical protein [Shewanella fidelis]MDR8522237.1 hypothetical protein [Shewanella fidelis]MDW4812547.1 hypothetical protein [Shewanella fidelis]MDW4816294.1 hypothetical protein [Shewanella fidelis]MDW4820788.1 hypothetical protein [Shewanella fidelis]MDW4825010.1 hypothetical protein [Shewanella fidelis]